MSIIFVVFIVVSIILVPFAYVKSVVFKLRALFTMKHPSHKDYNQAIYGFAFFIFTGIFTLLLDVIADSYNFWKNNFRSELKKIVVETEKNNISLESFKQIIHFC